MKRDRDAHHQKLVDDAVSADRAGDRRALWSVVKSLVGGSAKPFETVKDKLGNTIFEPEAIDKRWQEHFAEVLKANLIHDVSAADTCPREGPVCAAQCMPAQKDVEEQLWTLKPGKAAGPDGIQPGVLRAGGPVLVEMVHKLMVQIFTEQRVPVAMKGGKLARAWKRKGQADICANSRGLLVGDGLSKVLTGLLQARVMQPYISFVPRMQCGAVAKRGSDYANLWVRAMFATAQAMNYSICMVYLDLEKAFDLAIREFVMGWPQHDMGDKIDFLTRLGLERSRAEAVADLIDNGDTVLQRMRVDPCVIELIRGLHSRSWARVGDLQTAICSTAGGRQGCRLGGIIFNLLYTLALNEVADAFHKQGLTLRVLWDSSAAFWATGVQPRDSQHQVDCTFVDDEAFAIVARTPHVLDKRIYMALDIVATVFSKYALRINWGPGESAATIRYRRAGARLALDARRDTEGKAWIQLPPSAEHHRLEMVQCFVHLGSAVHVSQMLSHDAHLRATRTSAAYGKLAGSVFSSRHFTHEQKMSLANSLLWSRLFFQTQVWDVVQESGATRILSGPYHRVLRRIINRSLYQDVGNATDHEVRQSTGSPPVLAVIRCRRLRLARRLVMSGPPELLALLQSERVVDGQVKQLPWTSALIDDMCLMQKLIAPRLDALGHPSVDWASWVGLMRDFPHEWLGMVHLFSARLCHRDRVAPGGRPKQSGGTLQCDLCPATFCTNKALCQHKRAAHKSVTWAAAFIGRHNECLACGMTFSNRCRGLAHLNDMRRNAKCRELLSSGAVEPLHPDVQSELAAVARRERADARKQGHCQPQSSRMPTRAG